MNAFLIALQFLTRLKVSNQKEWTMEDFGKSVQTFPLVGMVIGLFMVLVYWLLKDVLTPQVLMLVLVIFEFLFTGGLHADGFMDTCDGLFSGRDRERKLEIMKDSRIGSNGVVGFVFLVLLKWQLLVQVNIMPIILPLLFILPTVSRYTMIMSIKKYPYARKEGMGQAFAQYSPADTLTKGTCWLGLPVLLSILLTGICIGWEWIYRGDAGWSYSVGIFSIIITLIVSVMLYLLMILLGWAINRVLNRYITKHLGGTTGDTYGFVTELSEVLMLFIFALIHSGITH